MAFKTKTFNLLGLILGIACLISIVISFASDRWVVSTEKETSGFKNIGLWSACFSKYRPPPWALIDKYYDGCWWVFDRELDDLRHFLFPPWFVGTQVLVTISLTFQILAIILMVINSINCFPYNKRKDLIALVLSLTTAVLHGLTAILSTVAIIMFGARADNERTWLEKPDQNYLSWSFGMCVLAAFLSVLAFMSVAVEFYRLRLLRRSNSEPKVLITTIAPPVTNYAYARHNPGFSPDQKDSVRHSQPAYTSRYSSERSQDPKPPNSLFAVSGAGEVYVNNSFVNDEGRDSRRARYPPYARRQFSPPPSDYGRPVNGKNYSDRLGSLQAKPPGPETNKSNDYEESKTLQHPVLPEYVPKTKSTEDAKKININNTVDESCDTDVTKKDLDSSNDNVEDAKTKSTKSKAKENKKDLDESNDADKKRKKDKKESRSDSKSRKSSKSRSDSAHKKKKAKKNDDKKKDARHSKRSKSKGSGNDDSDDDDEHLRSHHRSSERASKKSKRKQSHSRERSSSRHRSHSRDFSSEGQSDSDSTSVASRSRKKSRNKEGSPSRKNSRHRSASRDSQRKKRQDGNYTDDMSGSEYSSKSRSKRKGRQAEPGGKDKSKSRDYSDTESVRSRRSRRGDSNGRKLNKSREYSDTESLPSKRAASLGRQFGRSRDFSDTESVRSKQSRRGNIKPKASYSSYYEY